MKWLMLTGGSLCFFSLIAGAFSGALLFMLIPALAGLGCIAAASWHQHQLEKQAASWRAAYPRYKY